MNYRTILHDGSSILTEKKSKFIGHAFPVSTEEQATLKIEQVKKKYFDARHNVFAYRLRDNLTEKYSDDGEPQKTAGVPILELLKKEDITDICIVVTRYFGGTLLGTGGLVRAYSQAAAEAIVDAGTANMVYYSVFDISFDYQYFDRVSLLVKQTGGTVENTIFGENITASICILPEKEDEIKKAVTEMTGGKAEFSTVHSYQYKPEGK